MPVRTDAGFSLADSLAYMKDPKHTPVLRLCNGAECVAFHQRSPRPIELSSLQIGDVYIVHLPGEPMICFQLFAQGLRPGAFVAVAGYGDGGPGYLCPAASLPRGRLRADGLPREARVRAAGEEGHRRVIGSRELSTGRTNEDETGGQTFVCPETM